MQAVMPPLPHAPDTGQYDLTAALAEVAINDPRYGPTVQALRSLEAVAAIHRDLLQAQSALECAARITPTSEAIHERQDDSLMSEALFVHALMLYCRATHSSSKTRKRMDVLGSFDVHLRQAHQQITSLRDDVVAHYGPGANQPEGYWTRDHIVLHCEPDSFALSYPSVRAATKGNAVLALLAVINAATLRVKSYGTEKQNRLLLVLRERFADDAQLRQMIERHPFSEIAFFGRPYSPGSEDRRISVPAGTSL